MWKRMQTHSTWIKISMRFNPAWGGSKLAWWSTLIFPDMVQWSSPSGPEVLFSTTDSDTQSRLQSLGNITDRCITDIVWWFRKGHQTSYRRWIICWTGRSQSFRNWQVSYCHGPMTSSTLLIIWHLVAVPSNLLLMHVASFFPVSYFIFQYGALRNPIKIFSFSLKQIQPLSTLLPKFRLKCWRTDDWGRTLQSNL